MSIDMNLLAPTVILLALTVGQVWNTVREWRTGEVVWWAKHINVFGHIFIPIDYSGPARLRARNCENAVISALLVMLAIFVAIKFLGI